MNDIIFWGRNYTKFLAEALIKSPKLVTLDDKNDYKTLYASTPLVVNAKGEFMFLVRGNTLLIGQFARCASINNLGGYEAVLLVPNKRAIYDRIYPNTPYDIVNEEGETITITPPEKFGIFAD